MIDSFYKEKLINWQTKKVLDINLVNKYPRYVNKTGFLKINNIHADSQNLNYNYYNHIKFFLAKFFVSKRIGFIINEDDIKNQLHRNLFQYEHAKEDIKEKINTYIKMLENNYKKTSYPVEFLQGKNQFDLVYLDDKSNKQYIKIQNQKKRYYVKLRKVSEQIYQYSKSKILLGDSKPVILHKTKNRLVDFFTSDINTNMFLDIVEKSFLKRKIPTQLRNNILNKKELVFQNTGEHTFKIEYFTFRLKFDKADINSDIKIELVN